MAEHIQGICTTIDPLIPHADGVLRAKAALLNGTTWDIKQLPVYFMNGSEQYHQEVKTHVKTWQEFADIEFVFVDDPNALIRVSFEPPFSPQGQFNSVIGAQARLVPTSQPTVNLGFLPNTAEDEFQRLILHEFGHTLGLIHEHQSPNAGMRFKIPQVYSYFSQFGWSAQMVQSNILNRYTFADVSNATAFDMNSIMLYPFPAEIAEPATGINRVLSDLDKQFISKMYPGALAPVAPVSPTAPTKTPVPVAPGIPLTVGAAPIPGFLVIAGSRILYRFTVASPGPYVMETHGDQAWILSLFAASNLSTPLQIDDSGQGQGLNAKIARTLEPGTYFLALSHLIPDATGPFTISVRPA